MAPVPKDGYPDIVAYERDVFLRDVWKYEPGEHVTFIGKTGAGKTTLAFQLLQVTATPELPAIVLVMKPRDVTVTRWQKALQYRRTKVWPPMPSVWHAKKPPGWVLWPRFTFDPDKDDTELRKQFLRAFSSTYRKGNRILFGDEIYSLDAELGLRKWLITLYTKGRSMGAGFWGATQKPSHIPLWAYSQAEHLFLYNDPDKRARDRYGEIGGIDPDLLKYHVQRLERFEWLYVRRADATVCIIGA